MIFGWWMSSAVVARSSLTIGSALDLFGGTGVTYCGTRGVEPAVIGWNSDGIGWNWR